MRPGIGFALKMQYAVKSGKSIFLQSGASPRSLTSTQDEGSGKRQAAQSGSRALGQQVVKLILIDIKMTITFGISLIFN